MILNTSLWIRISINEIPGAISQGMNSKTLLFLIGPEQEPGNHLSVYSPFKEAPSEDDDSTFAKLYTQLSVLVKQDILQGPFGEDHPVLFARFCWTSDESQEALLKRFTDLDIEVKVREIGFDKDDAQVTEAVQMFSPWIDENTVMQPNPEIASSLKIIQDVARQIEEWKMGRQKQPRKSFFQRFFFSILVVSPSIAGFCILRTYS